VTLILFVPPVAYVAGYGPACWAISRNYVSAETVISVYEPLVQTQETGPKWVFRELGEYAERCDGGFGHIMIVITLYTRPESTFVPSPKTLNAVFYTELQEAP
jgi:hypothetical protein